MDRSAPPGWVCADSPASLSGSLGHEGHVVCRQWLHRPDCVLWRTPGYRRRVVVGPPRHRHSSGDRRQWYGQSTDLHLARGSRVTLPCCGVGQSLADAREIVTRYGTCFGHAVSPGASAHDGLRQHSHRSCRLLPRGTWVVCCWHGLLHPRRLAPGPGVSRCCEHTAHRRVAAVSRQGLPQTLTHLTVGCLGRLR